MGAFAVRHVRAGRLLFAGTIPNTLHDEGADYALRRMFPVGGGFATLRTDWKLCIGGINCMEQTATPNGTLGIFFPYDRQTSFAEITNVYANEGGAYGATHAGILGYARQAVAFAVLDQGRSAVVRTAEREFAHAIPWEALGSYDADEFQPPDFGWPAWKPVHRYPWDTPSWKPDYFGASGEARAWSDMLTGNPHTGATFSVGVAFIVSLEPTPILLCSTRLTRCLVIRPGDSLFVRYAGRVRPGVSASGAITTSRFARLLARRAWGDDPTAASSNYRAVLAANPAGSLSERSTWEDIVELVGDGYASAALTDWAKGGQDFEVVGQCTGFENTGDDPWQAANWFGVIADFEGSPVLCWMAPIDPAVAVPAGDMITFPAGVQLGLRDGYG